MTNVKEVTVVEQVPVEIVKYIELEKTVNNFVKVPQRIAVRIRIDPGQALSKKLGPGMSVIATVDTDSDR